MVQFSTILGEGLQFVQSSIQTSFFQQLKVSATLFYHPFVENNDFIGMLDGGQPVCDKTA